MGIAYFKGFMAGFKRFVGSLRYYKFDGHIILGVHPDLSAKELAYLKAMNVTLYTVHASDCDPNSLGRYCSVLYSCTVRLPIYI